MPGGEGSVTICIGELRAGREDAVGPLLDRYRGALEDYARRKLIRLRASRAVADEQDLAQEALLTVIDGLRKQKFENLKDRDDLIKLLRYVTWRGALKVKRHQGAARRAERAREGGPDGAAGGPRWEHRAEEILAQIAGREPDPRDLVAIREEFRAVLAALADERDRHLLMLMLEGYSQSEIARQFDCCERTVGLRFRRLRDTIRKRAAR